MFRESPPITVKAINPEEHTMIHETILSTIGHTPVVRINRLAPPDVEMYVKVESFNPMGSVKDRIAARSRSSRMPSGVEI